MIYYYKIGDRIKFKSRNMSLNFKIILKIAFSICEIENIQLMLQFIFLISYNRHQTNINQTTTTKKTPVNFEIVCKNSIDLKILGFLRYTYTHPIQLKDLILAV